MAVPKSRTKVENLRRTLRNARINQNFDYVGILSGKPDSLTEIIRYLLCEYDVKLTHYFVDKGYELISVKDHRLVEIFFKILRDEFSMRPNINTKQYFHKLFIDKKIDLLVDFIGRLLETRSRVRKMSSVREPTCRRIAQGRTASLTRRATSSCSTEASRPLSAIERPMRMTTFSIDTNKKCRPVTQNRPLDSAIRPLDETYLGLAKNSYVQLSRSHPKIHGCDEPRRHKSLNYNDVTDNNTYVTSRFSQEPSKIDANSAAENQFSPASSCEKKMSNEPMIMNMFDTIRRQMDDVVMRMQALEDKVTRLEIKENEKHYMQSMDGAGKGAVLVHNDHLMHDSIPKSAVQFPVLSRGEEKMSQNAVNELAYSGVVKHSHDKYLDHYRSRMHEPSECLSDKLVVSHHRSAEKPPLPDIGNSFHYGDNQCSSLTSANASTLKSAGKELVQQTNESVHSVIRSPHIHSSNMELHPPACGEDGGNDPDEPIEAPDGSDEELAHLNHKHAIEDFATEKHNNTIQKQPQLGKSYVDTYQDQVDRISKMLAETQKLLVPTLNRTRQTATE